MERESIERAFKGAFDIALVLILFDSLGLFSLSVSELLLSMGKSEKMMGRVRQQLEARRRPDVFARAGLRMEALRFSEALLSWLNLLFRSRDGIRGFLKSPLTLSR